MTKKELMEMLKTGKYYAKSTEDNWYIWICDYKSYDWIREDFASTLKIGNKVQIWELKKEYGFFPTDEHMEKLKKNPNKTYLINYTMIETKYQEVIGYVVDICQGVEKLKDSIIYQLNSSDSIRVFNIDGLWEIDNFKNIEITEE